MNRQDPLLSSSFHREISPSSEKNVRSNSKTVGCMSALIQFFYKSQNNRRPKFLTSGKKQETKANAMSSSSSSTKQEKNSTKSSHAIVVPRSPTLPPEMRVSSSENIRKTPALVARLMGLEEIPTAVAAAETAVVEKRRKLLGALEKCDKDLKALKKMIEVVKNVGNDNGNFNGNDEKDKIEVYYRSAIEKSGEFETSHVRVFDEFTRSAFFGYSKHYTTAPIGRVPLQQKKKPGEEDEIILNNFFDKIKTETIVNQDERNNYENLQLPIWTSKALIESVNEVCKDIEWGERREIGRIGLTLQDHICKDLIEEIVKEMGFYFIYQLPLESCKRSLRF